jgi:hypothetical protein
VKKENPSVKVGDEFWFVSLNKFDRPIWISKVMKITPKYAFFEFDKHPKYVGECRVLLEHIIQDSKTKQITAIINIRVKADSFGHRDFTHQDTVLMSKTKKDVLKKKLLMVYEKRKEVEDKINYFAKCHVAKINEYGELENQTASLEESIKQSE